MARDVDGCRRTNAVAASVVARWEGDLDPEESPDIEPLPAPAHVERTGKIHDHF